MKLNYSIMETGGILNDGEPRHCRVWDFPGTPKLEHNAQVVLNQRIYQRQKLFAPKVRQKRALAFLNYVLRG
jgi:hypothetical protein